MPPPGRKLRERHQDEGTLVQAGVGQNGGGAPAIVPVAQLMVCKEVEINHPRRPALSAYPAEPMFKLQQAHKKLRRRQRGLEFSHAIDVPWLAIVGHGLAASTTASVGRRVCVERPRREAQLPEVARGSPNCELGRLPPRPRKIMLQRSPSIGSPAADGTALTAQAYTGARV